MRRTALRWIALLSVVTFLSLGAGLTFAADTGSLLRLTATATPESLDPSRVTGENDWMVICNLYDMLVRPSQQDASPVPSLALSWSPSQDGRTWTFKLRNDARFADGTKLTSADVKFSMDRMIALGEGESQVYAKAIDQTLAPDPYTVVFKLKAPFGPFVSSLVRFMVVNKALIQANLAEGTYGANKDYGKAYLLSNSAGSGPYVIDSFKIRESVTIKKNANYWQSIPAKAPDKVIFTQLLEPATTKMLMADGEVDMVHGHQEDVTLQALLKDPGVKVADLVESGSNYFMMNTRKAPTDDVHIRRAISWAANYDQLRAVYGSCPAANGPVPQTVWGCATDLPKFSYDPAKARDEIAKSKYASSLGEYPVTLSYIQGNGDTGKLVMLLAKDMQSIGFNVKIEETPWVLFCNNEAAIATSPNITNLFASASYPEAGSILELKYASWTTGNWNQNEWLQDAKFDKNLNDALATSDANLRLKKYADIQKYLVSEVVPSVYTFVSVVRPAYRSDVFRWPAGDGKSNPLIEFNYYFKDFEMLK